MQNLGSKTLAFADKLNQWPKVLGSAVSLKWVKCLNTPKGV